MWRYVPLHPQPMPSPPPIPHPLWVCAHACNDFPMAALGIQRADPCWWGVEWQGYALIEYPTLDEARAAIDGAHKTKLLDQTVEVDFAFVRPPPGKRGGRGAPPAKGRARSRSRSPDGEAEWGCEIKCCIEATELLNTVVFSQSRRVSIGACRRVWYREIGKSLWCKSCGGGTDWWLETQKVILNRVNALLERHSLGDMHAVTKGCILCEMKRWIWVDNGPCQWLHSQIIHKVVIVPL